MWATQSNKEKRKENTTEERQKRTSETQKRMTRVSHYLTLTLHRVSAKVVVIGRTLPPPRGRGPSAALLASGSGSDRFSQEEGGNQKLETNRRKQKAKGGKTIAEKTMVRA